MGRNTGGFREEMIEHYINFAYIKEKEIDMKTKAEYLTLLRSYFLNDAQHYGVVRMGLFGSVVRNEQTDDSDVDIAYEGKPDILLRSRMKRELEALFGCKVDLIRLRKQLTGSTFEKNISKDLIYV
ncbi:nucleotidyltransferase family protein [Parabacteroides chinchillae]|uniref:Polymerase beta nucleotidyltransferase domain-containing protein n=1 Tax=Parabacteroides chinchillae TaxID=871327 RepID=A0A8G2FAA1_9BACT|nr:nucleotidyltransferase domain-containing protein [Parabacteroides chinchillae]SEF72906.1 hypothetical protein SAMN05444001_105164 [Parabacteroides chinchillae]